MAATQDVRVSGALLTSNDRITVNVGFKPAHIEGYNIGQVSGFWWNAGMPDDAMITTSGNAASAYVTTSGISLVDDGTSIGFSIGPDTMVKGIVGEEIMWTAIRGHDPK